MNALQNPLALLGRILIAWFFIIPGWGKLTGFAGAVGYAQSAGMPMPEVGVAVGLAIEILGGLALLLGSGLPDLSRTPAGADASAIATPAFVFHDLRDHGEPRDEQQEEFLGEVDCAFDHQDVPRWLKCGWPAPRSTQATGFESSKATPTHRRRSARR